MIFFIIKFIIQLYFINKIMKASNTDESTKIGMSEKGKDGFHKFNNQILKSQTKQLALLKHKCITLTSTIAYLKTQNQSLRQQKQNLLSLNNQYVRNLNKYYEDRANSIKKIIFPTQLLSDEANIEAKLKEYLKKHINGFKKLEGDHRNLVQHCLTMQKQIKNFKIVVDECTRMKQDLLSVNHKDVKQLVKQIQDVSEANKSLRIQNNKVIFELQKLKQDHQRSILQYNELQKQYNQFKNQNGQGQSIINRINEEAKQKTLLLEKRIYQLNVKCNVLEQQLRSDITEVNKAAQIKLNHQIEVVQYTHKQTQFQKTLSEYNRLLTSTGNSFVADESYKEKFLNGSFFNFPKANKQNDKVRRRNSRSLSSTDKNRNI